MTPPGTVPTKQCPYRRKGGRCVRPVGVCSCGFLRDPKDPEVIELQRKFVPRTMPQSPAPPLPRDPLADVPPLGYVWQIVHTATNEVVNEGFDRGTPHTPPRTPMEKPAGFDYRWKNVYTEDQVRELLGLTPTK